MPDALFTIPYPQHPHFVGREEDLARLHAALQEEGPVGVNPAALGNPTGVTGQGGIGKTQLAVAYAYRYRDEYPDGVYWINAAEDLRQGFAGLGQHFLGQGGEEALTIRLWETLRTRFSLEEARDLCFELGINCEEFSPQAGISSLAREIVTYCARREQLSRLEVAVRRLRGELATPQALDDLIAYAFNRLRELPRSLLILDNLAEPAILDEPLARDHVPGQLPGAVLFTTRRRELGRFRPIELKTLPPDAALALLLRDPHRAPALNPAHPVHAMAQDICATFGYLPLALEIASAHLAKFPAKSLTVYRDELHRRGALDVMAERRVTVETRHETGLAAALAAQWATLGEEAQTLLRVAGQLPEAAYVPTARLGLLAGVPDEGQSFFDITLDVAMNELNDTSLVEELTGDQVRLHPLVREFAHKQTPLEEKGEFREAYVRRLLAFFGDIETLGRQCGRRGIDALIQDLLAAQRLLDGVEDPATNDELRTFLRVLRREAHNLRDWRHGEAPAFLAQQLHNRLAVNEMVPLFGDLPPHARTRGPAWLVRWTTQRESLLEMTLTGHWAGVHAVAVTPDGQRAVSGGYDGTLRLWDMDTGREARMLAGHKGWVSAVAVTPDGQRAVSCGNDGTLRLWDLATGREAQKMAGHEGEVLAVAVLPDGRRAVSGGKDGTLRLWDLDSGSEVRTLARDAGGVNGVAVTTDGKRAVSGGDDGTLRVWDLDTGRETQKMAGHEGEVLAVAVLPDGRRAVSGGDDGTFRLWDLDSGLELRTLTGYEGWVDAVAVTADGRRAVSGGSDRTLQLWNLDTGRAMRTLTGHKGLVGLVYAVAVTPDGRRAVSGGDDRTLRLWDLDTSREVRPLTGHADRVNAVAVTAGQRVISGGRDGTLRLWDLNTGRETQKLAEDAGWVNAVAVTPDGRRAVSVGWGGLVLWNLDTGRLVRTLMRHAYDANAVAVTPDGRWAVSGGRDRALRLWDLDTGDAVRTLTGHTGKVHAVAVAPDGRRAISGSQDGTLRLWNLDSGSEVRTLIGHTSWVNAVAVTPDGRRAISGGDDRTLRVWNAETGQVERMLTGHVDSVHAVAVTPDGQRVISGSEDGTLRLWNLDGGQEIARVALDWEITCAAIAPSLPLLVAIGDAAGNVTCLELVEPE